MPNKLLPCHHCAHALTLTVCSTFICWDSKEKVYWVQCECGMRGALAKSKQQAEDFWNTRPLDSALRSACRALVEKWRGMEIDYGHSVTCADELEHWLRETSA